MKKSIIKRRKRVVPNAAGGEWTEEYEGSETQSEAPEPLTERGSLNDDGSINLGLRPHLEPLPSILPTPRMHHTQPTLPGVADLAGYQTSHARQPHARPDNDLLENRLAPITSMPATIADRQSSQSPASFMPPSRKRSFSSAEDEHMSGTPGNPEQSNRLSSIKSILNPSSRPEDEEAREAYVRAARASPGFVPSPGHRAQQTPSPLPSPYGTGHVQSLSEEQERRKAHRREELHQEARKMREALAAKEREIADMHSH